MPVLRPLRRVGRSSAARGPEKGQDEGLYVGPYPPTPDGIGNYTYELANAVRNDGNDVAVIVPRKFRTRLRRSSERLIQRGWDLHACAVR